MGVLKEARELVEQGWAIGHYHVSDSDGRETFCALGALERAAAGDMGVLRNANEALAAQLPYGWRQGEYTTERIWSYNDYFPAMALLSARLAMGRRKKKVLRLFDRAIEKQRG